MGTTPGKVHEPDPHYLNRRSEFNIKLKVLEKNSPPMTKSFPPSRNIDTERRTKDRAPHGFSGQTAEGPQREETPNGTCRFLTGRCTFLCNASSGSRWGLLAGENDTPDAFTDPGSLGFGNRLTPGEPRGSPRFNRGASEEGFTHKLLVVRPFTAKCRQ